MVRLQGDRGAIGHGQSAGGATPPSVQPNEPDSRLRGAGHVLAVRQRRIITHISRSAVHCNDGVIVVPYFALLYDVVDQFTERRAPFREAHLRLVRAAHARAEIFMAGAIGEPPEGALLVFRGDTAAVAEDFARNDPYVLEHVVTHWRALPWHVVVEPPAASGRPEES
jgi:uncharacterized protein YciI